MNADAVDVVATGATFSDHGEHSDIELEQPSHLVQLEGRRPAHAVSHGDEVLQFFDLKGEARVFAEQALLQGKPNYDTVKAAAPHHGLVVMNDYMLVSEPDLSQPVKEGELPPRLGLKVLDKAGQQAGDVAT
ncbi:hypothetical protein ABID21_003167 [Pseudorhizobium tarimense]|uniref:Uncharacterized protein n=1 Tax=Pseudorhizobium tarimense TaxID=1079109 RepID=A0ABV2H932_9HYPH|nr:hypothetical protein [Pseudorhizobium tarimense]